jgi:hypothetical protein
MRRGKNTITCSAADFGKGKILTAYIFDPNNKKSAELSFKELSEGLYTLVHNFPVLGRYTMVVLENGKSTKQEFIDIVL